MKEIIISSTKKIGASTYDYIYYEKVKTKNGEDEWKKKWFFSSLEACYISLLETFTKTKDKETLKENMEEAVELLKKLKSEIETEQHPHK